ncbi:MAG: hypothetical protein WAW52_07765 [Methanothrix sp.]
MDLYIPKSDIYRLKGTLSHAESCLQEMAEPILSIYSELRMKFEKQNSQTICAESAFIEETLNHLHTMGAQIETPSEVRNYFYKYSDIAKLAWVVSDQVCQMFDSNTQLSISVIDEEDEPDTEYLAIYLRTQSYDDCVMAKIVKIQESYYDSLSQMTGWLLFTTDFTLPR